MPRSPASGMPARDYSWPPFEKGNTAALRHGARSERRLAPIAEKLITQLLEQRPDLDDPRYAANLNAWGYAEAANVLYRAFADKHGVVDEHGNPLGFIARWQRSESQAEQRRRELGVGPVAEMKLAVARGEARLLAGDLTEVAERGRKVLEERERRKQLEADGDLNGIVED